jgi:nucleoside-diphosphate-sugar epimerase
MKTAADVVRADLDFLQQELAAEWPAMAGRRLLITGGAGFLGYYFTQAATHYNRSAAKADRVDLVVYDNLARGAPDWLNSLREAGELSLVTHDMRMPLPKDFGHVDYVVHAASVASPTYYRAHPVETMDANINGLRSLLDYARARMDGKDPMKGIVFLSSSEIYGDPAPSAIPTSEDYRGFVSCTGPRACYDEAKRFGETLCTVFANKYGVAAKIARPFNNYGPGLKINDGRVLPDFARDVLAGRDIVMLSDGKATRTFCYVADAIAGYYKVMVNGRNGEPYNIGTETPEVSVRELAEKVAEASGRLFGYQGKFVMQAPQDRDYLVDNPNRRCPIIKKAREEIGYEPKVEFADGLDRTLLWYRDNQVAVPEPWISTTPGRTEAA